MNGASEETKRNNKGMIMVEKWYALADIETVTTEGKSIWIRSGDVLTEEGFEAQIEVSRLHPSWIAFHQGDATVLVNENDVMPVEPTTQRCEYVNYAYPHPGCAEFGPPDEIGCGRMAVKTVERSGMFGTERMRVCGEHHEFLRGAAEEAGERFASYDEVLPRNTDPMDDEDGWRYLQDAIRHAFGVIGPRNCYACYCDDYDWQSPVEDDEIMEEPK